ncbi:MAG TPA: diaminopimelate epimerase [Flavitalea sp.]|nr:diaminopimelate epimerase [Flavitalea sp.]
MLIQFDKYQGTGNDFIILDNRSQLYSDLTNDQVNFLCDRRFGIGADGLMLLNDKEGFDFEMVYYNSDGREGTMCGNGGRCLIKFAYDQGIHRSIYHFSAADGDHQAEIDPDGIVSLKMKNVDDIKVSHGDFILDTGSPHYVKMISNVMEYDVFKKGREIRYSSTFAENGINVNYVEQKSDDEIIVRTYERGVENETFSCGTGVTAAALVCYHNENGFNDVTVQTKGGSLSVEYDRIDENHYENIWLCGPAERVFTGKIEI